VYLTAKSAGELAGAVINNTGVIQARTMQGLTGTITLLADEKTGTINVGGTLDTSAAQGDGGVIETSAAHVKLDGGVKVTTAAARHIEFAATRAFPSRCWPSIQCFRLGRLS
jgi:hypothetical protein